jgi:hypothetical protein
MFGAVLLVVGSALILLALREADHLDGDRPVNSRLPAEKETPERRAA